jgi:hypothetical protein
MVPDTNSTSYEVTSRRSFVFNDIPIDYDEEEELYEELVNHKRDKKNVEKISRGRKRTTNEENKPCRKERKIVDQSKNQGKEAID